MFRVGYFCCVSWLYKSVKYLLYSWFGGTEFCYLLLVWKAIYFSINLNEILARYSSLGCRIFPSIALNISCHSLLACRVSAERTAVKHMGFPLYVTCCFSLAAFNILSLCLVFVWLVCVLACFSLGLSCMGLFGPPELDWLFPFLC